jgi:hypothetical protein
MVSMIHVLPLYAAVSQYKQIGVGLLKAIGNPQP